MNYEECKATKLRQGRKVLHKNVWLEQNSDVFHVRYYDTDVVTFFPDGRVILRHGGYVTKSTGEVMVAFGPEGLSITHRRVPSGHLIVTYGKKTIEWKANDPTIQIKGKTMKLTGPGR